MEWKPTLIAAGACLVLAVFAGWRGARKWDPNRGPRLIPWRAIMLLAAAALMLLLLHATSLLREG